MIHAKDSVARDSGADDAFSKSDAKTDIRTDSRLDPKLLNDLDDPTVPKLLRGPISIEESMRLRRDLDEYSRSVDPAHVQIEERRRLMHQRIQSRFTITDKDSDGKISRLEATESLPQVARHFSQVDTNSDGYITLDELEGLQARIVERQRAEAIKIDEAPESDVVRRKNKDAMVSSRKRTL